MLLEQSHQKLNAMPLMTTDLPATRTCARSRPLAAAGLIALLGQTALCTPNPEVEPNSLRGNATLADSAGAGLTAGDTLIGSSTGSSTTVTVGLTSLDVFRVRTAPAAPGIYRHRLVLSTPTSTKHTGTIRGLVQNSGEVSTADVAFATSAPTTTPPYFCQWYGFGKQEQLYYSVSGTPSTSQPYISTYQIDPIAPIEVGQPVLPGLVTLGNSPSNSFDTSWLLLDANYNIIDNAEDNAGAGARKTVTLGDGVYYMAFSDYRTASNVPTPEGDSFRSGNLLDFGDLIANASTNTITSYQVQIVHSGSTINLNLSKPSAFDVSFIRFVVGVPTTPEPIRLTSRYELNSRRGSPADAPPYFGLITVEVAPGTFPDSSGLSVTANLSSMGLPGPVTLLDDGLDGDLITVDGIYTYRFASDDVPAGTYLVPVTATDEQARSTTINCTVRIREGVVTLSSPWQPMPVNGTPTIATGDAPPLTVQWFLIAVPAPVFDPESYLDLATELSDTLPIFDTEMALYNSSGTKLAEDNDSGPTLLSQLSFGSGTAPRPSTGDGLPFSGGAALDVGTYYLAVGINNTVFNANLFDVVSVSQQYGNVRVRAVMVAPGAADTCLADLVAGDGNPPGDGIVDGNDFQAFLNAFGAGEFLGDLVGGDGNPPADASVDGNDFSAFLNAFAAGC